MFNTDAGICPINKLARALKLIFTLYTCINIIRVEDFNKLKTIFKFFTKYTNKSYAGNL